MKHFRLSPRLIRFLRPTGEVRRVLSHVNGQISIRGTVFGVDTVSSRVIKGGKRLYLLRWGSRTNSDEMKTCKTNLQAALRRVADSIWRKSVDCCNDPRTGRHAYLFPYNRISSTLTLLSSAQLASCNPSRVLRHASLFICATCA